MADFIVSIREDINQAFPQTWYEAYSFENEEIPEIDKVFTSFKELVKPLRAKIFNSLNASVLIGEYCKYDNFDQLIQQIHDQLDIISQPTPPRLDVQTFLQKNLNDNFIRPVKLALDIYSELYLLIKRRYDIDDRKFVKAVNPELALRIKGSSFDGENIKDLIFLAANTSISDYDRDLKSDEKTYEDLRKFSEGFMLEDQYGGHTYSLLLRKKCDYLILKWILRQKHLNKAAVYSLLNNQEQEIQIEDSFILSRWKSYIESHYELSNSWKSEIQRNYDLLKGKPNNVCSLFEIHKKIKYFKDVDCNAVKLRELRIEVYERYNSLTEESTKDTKYAYSIACSYVINNEFSLLLSQRQINDELIRETYAEILNLQSSTGVKNFFPHYKYLSYLVRKLKTVYDQRKALEFIIPAREIINECEQIINTYRNNIKWSEKHYNFAFQLPYEECLIDYESVEIPKIHLFSSFLLPLSKEQYISEFENNVRDVMNLKSSIEIFENLEKDLSEFNVMKKEIQNRDVKSIEILGIFTAIVTFIAASLPTFKYINSAKEAGMFMLSLSASLVLFLIVLVLISRRKKYDWLIIIGIGIFAFFSWQYLVNQTENNTNNREILESDSTEMAIPKNLIHKANKSPLPDTIKKGSGLPK